ncbi:MAG: DMT family transporter [Solirubrobacterales bacterium]
MIPILLALVAALIFALATVLQQRVAMTASDRQARSPLFLLRLARNPVWLAGIVLVWIGYGFHVAALSGGQLVVVQPILAMTMVFALPIGARLSAQRIDGRDLLAALLAAAGLAAFLLVSEPVGGVDEPSAGAWLAWGGGSAAAAAALVWAARGRRPNRRAALAGTAAGILFGLHGALTKGLAERLHEGIGPLLGSWVVWAALLVALLSMAVSQIALQAGDLAPAIATESVVDPVVSVLLGVGLFAETIHGSAAGNAASLAALAAMLAGVGALSVRTSGRWRRSPLPTLEEWQSS